MYVFLVYVGSLVSMLMLYRLVKTTAATAASQRNKTIALSLALFAATQRTEMQLLYACGIVIFYVLCGWDELHTENRLRQDMKKKKTPQKPDYWEWNGER